MRRQEFDASFEGTIKRKGEREREGEKYIPRGGLYKDSLYI